VYPANIQDTSEAINHWVIVGSVIGALVVFVVLGVILWKVSMPIHVTVQIHLHVSDKNTILGISF
jgi:uncharacterized membrane protein